MVHSYISRIRWSDDEEVHGTMELDCGYSCSFHKPVEFGGREGVMNPEDAFVGSVAMCYSITFKEVCKKMRLNILDFELETEGVLEEVDGKRMISKIILSPHVTSTDAIKKVERAVDLAKDNCLIARSVRSEMILEPNLEKK